MHVHPQWNLARDDIGFVHLMLPRNSAAPSDALELLAYEKHYEIPCAVGSNPSTPVRVLRLLSEHDWEEVRSAAPGGVITQGIHLEGRTRFKKPRDMSGFRGSSRTRE